MMEVFMESNEKHEKETDGVGAVEWGGKRDLPKQFVSNLFYITWEVCLYTNK